MCLGLGRERGGKEGGKEEEREVELYRLRRERRKEKINGGRWNDRGRKVGRREDLGTAEGGGGKERVDLRGVE